MAYRLVRGGREPGAGQPGQELVVGHAPPELRQPEGQPAAVHSTGRSSALLDDLHDERPAGEHAGGHDRRVRPDAEDQQGRRPRPLGTGDDGRCFAGGGVHGGTVIGATDRIGGLPRQPTGRRPENLAATIYHALGIPAARRPGRTSMAGPTSCTAPSRSPALLKTEDDHADHPRTAVALL